MGASGFLYKPNTRKGPVFISPVAGQGTPTVTFADGRTVNMLRGDQIGGVFRGHEGYQYGFDRDTQRAILSGQNIKLNFNGESFTLGSGAQRYQGSSFTGMAPNNKGMGGMSYMDDGSAPYLPPGVMGGGANGVMAFPFWPGAFPSWPGVTAPKDIKYKPYNINVQKFVSQFGEANREQYAKNFKQAQGFGLELLDTELAGLRKFVPGAAELSRQQTAADNRFNQQQRTAQLQTVLPHMQGMFDDWYGTLDAQGERAAAYAEGRLPDKMLDRAMELGVRSRAADVAGATGIGPRSMQASKMSDLMSAEQRFQIGQYGEQLTSSNIGQEQGTFLTEAELKLAPLSYAQTGQRINVMPEVGAGRYAQGIGSEMNQMTTVTPGQALQTQVQVGMFNASNRLNTQQFNSNMKFQESQINAQGIFNASMGQFAATTSYLNNIQAANQGLLNANMAMHMQGIQSEAAAGGMQQSQSAQQIGAVSGAIGAVAGAVQGIAQLSGSAPMAPASAPAPSQAPSAPAISTPSAATSAAPASAPAPVSPSAGVVEVGAPGAMRLPASAPVPAGMVPVSRAADGSVLAASSAPYQSDLMRFAKVAGNPQATNAVAPAVRADVAISEAAGLSFVPTQIHSAPVGITTSGRQVFANPAAVPPGDISVGTERTLSSVLAAMQLGYGDEKGIAAMAAIAAKSEQYAAAGNLGEALGLDPNEITTLSADSSIVSRAAETFLPQGSKLDLNTEAGAQFAMGVMRLNDLWPNLNPGQRSAALASLAMPAAEVATGKPIAETVVPGTDKALGDPLKIRDVIDLTTSGTNGFALARNYNQTAALAGIVLGRKGTPKEIAKIAEVGGFLGFGPQGASIQVEPGYLKQMGAQPAPVYGVGAVKFDRPEYAPKGYEVLGQDADGKVIAIPGNLKHTVVSNPVKAASFVKEHPAVKNLWGKSKLGGVRGSAGGSAFISAARLTPAANPELAGGMVAHTLFRNLVGKA